MMQDLDESIKQLLIKKVPLEPSQIDVSFEAPDREWEASQSKPTVNLYLYDIRENHELRSYDWAIERNQNKTATKKRAPIRIDLSYLTTVWTKDVGDEHRLLGHLLVTMMRYPVLPEEVLQGALKDMEYPIHTSTAQPDGLFKNPADFWSALDNQLKPSINYVVTLPVDLEMTITAPVVWTKAIEIKGMANGEAEEILEIGGFVHEKGKPGAVIAQAAITVKEAQLTTRTDDSGRYIFPKLPRGKYTFQVSTPGRPIREARVVVPSESYNIELQGGE